MQEVKEKSPLKARTAETLKSAPQAAFRRGVDVAFQQLRQELREAAQDGQMEDRYESGKITEIADHTVRQAEHLAEKALHKQPKARSAPQQEGRRESNPQRECPHPQQPAAAPREYPPVSVQPNYPPQSQPQVNQSVRESASPIREKPVPPTSGKQPKMREYTPDAKTPVSPSQHPASWIHENARSVATETMSLATERAVHEPAASIKEKLYSPANVPQPRMREHTPNAKASASQSRYPVPQTHENARAVSAETMSLATEHAVLEPASPIKEKRIPKADAPQPKVRESAQKAEQPVHPSPTALRVPEKAQDFTEIHPAPEAARHQQEHDYEHPAERKILR